MNLKVISVRENFSTYSHGLQKLEELAEYPYGNDFFKLDHGEYYFAFFERLGKATFNLAMVENEIVGCAAGILRRIPNGDSSTNCWYLCDLKVKADYLGKRIPSLIFRKNLLRNYLKCGRAYAISMNPQGGENRVVRLLKRFSWIPFAHSTSLNFYTLNYDQVSAMAQDLVLRFGSDSFLSLAGVKDLILRSSGEKMPLLHYQRGPFAVLGAKPRPGAIHMFCAPLNSELDRFLSLLGHSPTATASVISHRMPRNASWDFILSSDI